MTAANSRDFSVASLAGEPRRKAALLINPPLYDTQYWAEWSQPYGLLRIASLLQQRGYKKLWFYDFLETDEDRKVGHHRINFQERYGDNDRPDGRIEPCRVSKGGEQLEVLWRHFGNPW